MLNGKKRAYLRSIANTTKPTTQIGKDGITEEFLEQLDDQLRAREIVKVNILETAGLDTKEAANSVCEAIRAEFVQAIGSKFTVYKKNLEETKIIFPGHEQAKAKKKGEPRTNRVTKKQASYELKKTSGGIRNKGKSKKK